MIHKNVLKKRKSYKQTNFHMESSSPCSDDDRKSFFVHSLQKYVDKALRHRAPDVSRPPPPDISPRVIYVIHHETFEDTNVFTTQFEEIESMIEMMREMMREKIGTPTERSEWKYRAISELTIFQADMQP